MQARPCRLSKYPSRPAALPGSTAHPPSARSPAPRPPSPSPRRGRGGTGAAGKAGAGARKRRRSPRSARSGAVRGGAGQGRRLRNPRLPLARAGGMVGGIRARGGEEGKPPAGSTADEHRPLPPHTHPEGAGREGSPAGGERAPTDLAAIRRRRACPRGGSPAPAAAGALAPPAGAAPRPRPSVRPHPRPAGVRGRGGGAAPQPGALPRSLPGWELQMGARLPVGERRGRDTPPTLPPPNRAGRGHSPGHPGPGGREREDAAVGGQLCGWEGLCGCKMQRVLPVGTGRGVTAPEHIPHTHQSCRHQVQGAVKDPTQGRFPGWSNWCLPALKTFVPSWRLRSVLLLHVRASSRYMWHVVWA